MNVFVKRWLKGFYMSLGMFQAIPLPAHVWDDACKNLMLPCFPLVGILIGMIWWGAAELLGFLGMHAMVSAAILAVLPFFLTGFLHLDGYMDTSDAVLSRRPLEDKLRILKDPHTGAFSVIMIGVLLLLQFAAIYAAVDLGRRFMLLIFITVISRCCASAALQSLPVMAQSGYANMLRQGTRGIHKACVIYEAALAVAAACWFAGLSGLICVGATVIGFACAMAYSYKEFKGVSGDLAGYAITIGELCGLFALGVAL